MKQTGAVDVWKIERQAQFVAAQRLVGCTVRWAHDPSGPSMRVEEATSEGMVRVTGYSGDFAPHLFVRVDAAGAVDPNEDTPTRET
jgi:hypothetical protein